MSRLTKRRRPPPWEWTSSVRFVDTEMARPRWRFTLNYRFHHRTQVGIEFNPKAQEICPLLTLFLLTETEKRPALFVGTSSDRIGSPSGKQSYYVLRSENIYHFCTHLCTGVWITPNGMMLSTFHLVLILSLGKVFPVRTMHDGDLTHLLLNCFSTHYGVSLTICMAWNLRRLIFCWIINILLQRLQLFS